MNAERLSVCLAASMTACREALDSHALALSLQGATRMRGKRIRALYAWQRCPATLVELGSVDPGVYS